MDEFWFETRKGFCEHYASAVTIILRSVNLPARVVVGYQGGEWNPIAHYLTIQQRDAHAWVEYWEEGSGWQQLDPTFYIAPERIDQTILDQQNQRLNHTEYLGSYHLSWLQQSKLLLESARFLAERWLLFYNQDTQRNLLAHLGLGHWGVDKLLQAAIAFIILFIIIMGLWYLWWQKQSVDPLLIQYHLLQKEFKRFKVLIHPSATLIQQCQSLMNNAPNLSSLVTLFLSRYEQLRLQHSNSPSKENDKQTRQLFKEFLLKLKNRKLDG
jgi:hypothetical protein